jgi:chromosome segregation ATPase
METRLAELSSRQENLEKTLTQKEGPINEALLEFEKSASSVKENMAKIQKNVESFDGTKADKKTLEAQKKELADQIKSLSDAVAGLQQNLNPMRENLEKVQTGLKSVQNESKELSAKMDKLESSVEGPRKEAQATAKELNRMKSEMVDVLATTIDRKSLDSALAQQKKAIDKDMDFIIRTLGEKEQVIRGLEKRIKDLENQNKSRPTKPIGTPKPGSILEQDIQ